MRSRTEQGQDADAAIALASAARRPSREVVSLLEAFQVTGREDDGSLLLAAVGARSNEEVAVVADALRGTGRIAEVATLLSSAAAARPSAQDIANLSGLLPPGDAEQLLDPAI